jgi:cyclic dehypoxanthinyl futalosine synthase
MRARRSRRSGAQGQKVGHVALTYGANDPGSIMGEDYVVSQAAPAFHMTLADVLRLISELGYESHQRDNGYRLVK